MNKFWEKFFYVFTYITQGSSYLNPRAYAIMHRMHHAYSDTEKDPHSPHFFKDVWGMMLTTRKIYNDYRLKLREPENEFKGNYPEWDALDKVATSGWSSLAWGTFYVLFYLQFATSWWMFLLLPIHFLMGPVHGALVNWCGHKYGYSNYDNQDKSKNTTPMGILMMGELFQNNHHKFPNSPNFAKKWWELDATYPVMRTLHFFGIIKLRKTEA